MNNDLQLQKHVVEELEFEASVDAAHIGVSVRDGVVTLSGHVGSFSEKHAAEQAAQRVKGVVAVAQHLEIEFPSDSKTSDDEIAHRVLKILSWHKTLPIDRIVVKVEHGVVTLTGKVDWYLQKVRADADVRRLSGVREVLNELEVAISLRAEDIREQISAALGRHRLDADSVTVVVDCGKVTLGGTVKTDEERDIAARVAWAPQGVSEVENNIGLQRHGHSKADRPRSAATS